MKSIVIPLVVVMVILIIFVRAGQKGGESGGVQASRILQTGLSGLSGVVDSLTGGGIGR